MNYAKKLISILVILFLLTTDIILAKSIRTADELLENNDKKFSNIMLSENEKGHIRLKRQLDFEIGADHEEGIGTDISAFLTANLYKSKDGLTRLDGKAKYSQYFNEFSGAGKAKIGGSLHLSHMY